MVPQESDWKAIGIHEYRVISTDDIPFEPEIRKICEDNVCRLYGKTWACRIMSVACTERPGLAHRQLERWSSAKNDVCNTNRQWCSVLCIRWRIVLTMKG